jgi:4-amino-4-deoxy-L-arabinose transferase-like glycosyltransferase
MKPRISRERVVLALILLGGAALRLFGLTFGLPVAGAHPDEMTVVIISTGLLFAGLNPKFFHWPSLWFYAVAGFYRIGWEIGHLLGWYRLKFDMYRHAAADAVPFLLASRGMSAACGTLTIWLVYRLSSRLFDRATALAAASFLAAAFLHVRDSHFGVTDVPTTMLIVASLIPLASALELPGRRRSWAASGVLAGLAASTKYNGGLAAVAALATALGVWIGGSPSARRAASAGLALYVVSAAAAFVAGTPFALIDHTHFVEALQFDAHHLETGHGIDLGLGLLYHLRFSLWYGVGWPLLLTSIGGMVIMPMLGWRKAALVLAFPVVYYAAVGSGHTVFVRYVTPVIPFLCISAGLLVIAAIRRLASPSAGVPLATAAVAAIAALPLRQSMAFDTLLAVTDTRAAAAEWFLRNAGRGDWLYQSPETAVFTDFGFPPPIATARFDRGSRTFLSPHSDVVWPRWLIVAESPLLYTADSSEILSVARERYATAFVAEPSREPEPAEWFDRQDAWYLPYANFSRRLAPGPTIRILRRVDN